MANLNRHRRRALEKQARKGGETLALSQLIGQLRPLAEVGEQLQDLGEQLPHAADALEKVKALLEEELGAMRKEMARDRWVSRAILTSFFDDDLSHSERMEKVLLLEEAYQAEYDRTQTPALVKKP